MAGFAFELIPEDTARMGLIVLKSDETLENEFRALMPRDAELFHSRIPSQPEVTRETLMQMQADLPEAAASIPASFDLSVVGYACTSGATVIGPETVETLIRGEHPGAAVTNPVTAVTTALHHLQVKRVGFVSPYIAPVSQAIRDHLEAAGFAVANLISFEQMEEHVVARISQQSVLEAVVNAAADDDVDAVFVSCTNLKTIDIIDDAERQTGKPVISSNLALAWHMLSLGGIGWDKANQPGMLFRS